MLTLMISCKLRTLFCFVIENAYCSQSFHNKFECGHSQRKWCNVSGSVLQKVHLCNDYVMIMNLYSAKTIGEYSKALN